MKRRNIRVMLASEHPETRSLLREIIESEDRAAIVGQAESAPKAVALARNLRPDVAVIDSYLPHMIGLDSVPLSRMGGLDTAQTISNEIPNVRVVLLNSLEDETLTRGRRGISFCRESQQTCVPFTLGELQLDTVVPPGALVFARVLVRAKAPARKTIGRLSDKAVYFGGLGFLAGGILTATLILSGAGIYLAMAGIASLLIGLVGKLVSRMWE